MTYRRTSSSFRAANTEVVFVSCDTSAARQAWRRQLGAEYVFASDFWDHGAVARSYGVFNEETGAPVRGTFLIDLEGTVIWSLVTDTDTRRERARPGVARKRSPLRPTAERRLAPRSASEATSLR